jgi:hypothetical protein
MHDERTCKEHELNLLIAWENQKLIDRIIIKSCNSTIEMIYLIIVIAEVNFNSTKFKKDVTLIEIEFGLALDISTSSTYSISHDSGPSSKFLRLAHSCNHIH